MSLEQIRTFLEASGELRFKGRNREEVDRWAKPDAATAAVSEIEAQRPGAGAALRVEDDGAKSGAGDTACVAVWSSCGSSAREGSCDWLAIE